MLDTPMWPDFSVELDTKWETIATWRASTGTMRPPIKNGRGQTFVVLYTTTESDPDKLRKDIASYLRKLYLNAHPDNCAGVMP